MSTTTETTITTSPAPSETTTTTTVETETTTTTSAATSETITPTITTVETSTTTQQTTTTPSPTTTAAITTKTSILPSTATTTQQTTTTPSSTTTKSSTAAITTKTSILPSTATTTQQTTTTPSSTTTKSSTAAINTKTSILPSTATTTQQTTTTPSSTTTKSSTAAITTKTSTLPSTTTTRTTTTTTTTTTQPPAYSRCPQVCDGWSCSKLLPYGPSYGDVDFASTAYYFCPYYMYDDGFVRITLPQTIMFGCTQYSTLWINVNGYLTLGDTHIISWYPNYFPFYAYDYNWYTGWYTYELITTIAPFWEDFDLRAYAGVDPGNIYYQCYSRDYIGQPLSAAEQEVFDKTDAMVHTYYGDYGFSTTMACIVTWVNVRPYPGYYYWYYYYYYYYWYYGYYYWYWYMLNEQACFQVALVSDIRSYRSYTLYNYNKFQDWQWWRWNTQGFQIADKTIDPVNLYSSWWWWWWWSPASWLPYTYGNRGALGQWQFQTSNSYCELGSPSPYYLCYDWVGQQQSLMWYNPNYWWYFSWAWEPCPCFAWQAWWDFRFWMDWRTYCAYSSFSFWTFGQSCCYDWWTGELITYPSYEAGSFYWYHPFWYQINYYENEYEAKKWCCLMSNLCDLYYTVRPLSTCWGYIPPWWGWFWGDPHIKTPDGLRYTFNGWGEYQLLKNDECFDLQARTDRAWDGNGVPTNNATIFSAFAGRGIRPPSQLNGNQTTYTSKIHVELNLTRNGVIIMVDDSTPLTDWFLTAPDGETKSYSGMSVRKNNGTLAISFTSGDGFTVSVGGQQLQCTVQLSPSNKGTYKGLFGNINGIADDDLTARDGTVLPKDSSERDIFYNFGQTWLIQNETDSLFYYGPGQAYSSYRHPDHIPVFGPVTGTPEQEQRASEICRQEDGSINQECKQDYLRSGNEKMAAFTLETDTKNTKVAQQLAMNIVNVNVSSASVKWIVGQTHNLTITLHDSNQTEIVTPIVNFTAPGSDWSISQTATRNEWLFKWTPTSHEQVLLSFSAVDSSGARAPSVVVRINLCNCSGERGQCVWEQQNPSYNETTRFSVAKCYCQSYYLGPFCEVTRGWCQSQPCGPGSTCTELSVEDQIKFERAYNCSDCAAGYNKYNGTKCIDTNECISSALHNCSLDNGQVCRNLQGSFECICGEGYTNVADSSSGSLNCTDTDECGLLTSNCTQNCSNVAGGYQCSCVTGYHLSATDNSTCINDTTSQPDSATTPHGYTEGATLKCHLGYELISGSCQDINECQKGTQKCTPGANCINTDGSYDCGCSAGSALDRNKRTCSSCRPGQWGIGCRQCNCNATDCDSVIGCTKCFSPNITGPNCNIPISLCDTPGACPTNSVCDRTQGAFGRCRCNQWYTEQLDDCVPIDACRYDLINGNTTVSINGSRCMNGGACINGTGSVGLGQYRCLCAPGYTGGHCEIDINDCGPNPCQNGGTCTDKVAAFTCSCVFGYYGATCQNAAATLDTTVTEDVSTASTNAGSTSQGVQSTSRSGTITPQSTSPTVKPVSSDGSSVTQAASTSWSPGVAGPSSSSVAGPSSSSVAGPSSSGVSGGQSNSASTATLVPSDSSSSTEATSSGPSTGLIVGAVIGGIAGLFLLIGLVAGCMSMLSRAGAAGSAAAARGVSTAAGGFSSGRYPGFGNPYGGYWRPNYMSGNSPYERVVATRATPYYSSPRPLPSQSNPWQSPATRYHPGSRTNGFGFGRI